jgi:ATP-dependent exoDNAse (exonuclease V) alpha subunit
MKNNVSKKTNKDIKKLINQETVVDLKKNDTIEISPIKDNLDKDKNQIELTKDQEAIYSKMIDFVKSETENEILLVGYAGTGKTTMMAKFINDLINNKICKKIVMAAPTHKAVNIAKSKLFGTKDSSEELSKIINIMTIHRLLNYQSYVGQEGEKFFAKGKIDPNWSIYDLVVVDECSMLTNQIINDIKEQVKKETNHKLKVIYVGDPAQLPPVNQTESKIFDGSIKTLTLEKIIRTSNQKIMELSNSHRKWIFSKKESDIPHLSEYESEYIKLYSTENKEVKKWLDDFIDLIKTNVKNKKIISEFDDGVEYTETNTESEGEIVYDCDKMIDNHNNNIILTWTNKKSNIYNQYIREKIFNKKNLAQWEIGEILIFNDFHRRDMLIDSDDNCLDELDIKEEKRKSKKIEPISFYTSEQVKLTGIKEIKYKFNQLKFKINNNITPELNEKFKKYYKKINETIQNELSVYEMKIQKIIDIIECKDIIQEYTILNLHPESEKQYNTIIDTIEQIVIKLKKVCYDLINKLKDNDMMKKCELQSEVEKKINRLYKEYLANIVDCFAQLNYGYCITVHKSQGSTFKNVFIDMNDIFDNNNFNETTKCLYTSITRSSKSLNLLI